MIDVSQEVHAAIGDWAIAYKPLLTQPAFDELERRVMALCAAERERCATLCKELTDRRVAEMGLTQEGSAHLTGYQCAAAIRAMS